MHSAMTKVNHAIEAGKRKENRSRRKLFASILYFGIRSTNHDSELTLVAGHQNSCAKTSDKAFSLSGGLLRAVGYCT